MTCTVYTYPTHRPDITPPTFQQTCEASLRLSHQRYPGDSEMQAAKSSLSAGLPLNSMALEALRRSLISNLSLVESGQVCEPHLSLSNIEDALGTLRPLRCVQAVQA